MEELENTSSLFNTSPVNKEEPKKSLFNSNAVLPISKTTKHSGVVEGYNLGIGDSKYDEGITAFTDFDTEDLQGSINEFRANNQSWVAKSSLGLGRVITKAASEVAKIPGMVGGLVMAPFADENEGFETVFNNQWIKTINNLNETINTELLPVYVKKAVQEGNLWDNISSVDFWATDGADGIGFITSMLVPGAALKSLNAGEKILGATAKGLSLVNGRAGLAGATRALTELGLTANNIDLAAITTANTLFEAGAEAGSAIENFEKKKEDWKLNRISQIDKLRRSGEINIDKANQLISEDNLEKEFAQQKGRLGRDMFLSNLAILLVPNAIQSQMLFGKAGARQLSKQLNPSLLSKLGNRGKDILKATASEGFLEEGTQTTVENRFSESAFNNQLKANPLKDTNVSELVDAYLDTVSSTEGQKAIFLGGFLGGGMMAYHGAKNDAISRNTTNTLLDLAESQVNHFNNIYDTDPYQRDEENNIITDENNVPQYDPVKVNKIAKALQFTDMQSKIFEQAIQEGDEETVNSLKENAINQLIIPFINTGEQGLQALEQHLESTRNTEELQNNPQASEIISDIMEKAKYMQDQYQAYKDFSKDLINLNNENATDEDYKDFYNDLADTYLNYKGREYSQRKLLEKLNSERSKVIKDLKGNENIRTEEVVDENATEDMFKYRYEKDPRIKLLDEKINKIKQSLKNIDTLVNETIWDSEELNKAFKIRVDENNTIREENSPENIEKVNEEVEKVNTATTEEEVDNLKIENPVVQKQAEVKKEEIKQQKEAEEQQEKEVILNSDEILNAELEGIKNSNQGDIILFPSNHELKGQPAIFDRLENDNAIVKNAQGEEIKIPLSTNNTSEINNAALNNATDGNDDSIPVTNNENKLVVPKDRAKFNGAKVISTNRETGAKIDFVSDEYLAYERTPRDKKGEKVNFEINTLNNSSSLESEKADIEKRREVELKARQGVSTPKLSIFPNSKSSNPIKERKAKELEEEIKNLREEDGSISKENLFKFKELQKNIKKLRGAEVETIEDIKERVKDANISDIIFSTLQGRLSIPFKEANILKDMLMQEGYTEEEVEYIFAERDDIPKIKDRYFEIAKNKINTKYDAELATLQTTNTNSKNSNWTKAIEAYNNKDFSDKELLYNHLPINIKFTDTISAPMETAPKTKDALVVFNETTLPLRKLIIDALAAGNSIENITSKIEGQYEGSLKVQPQIELEDGTKLTPENNILDLQFLRDKSENDKLKYLVNNLFMVNWTGSLENVINKDFVIPTTLEGKGEIYLQIPMNNGKPFNLKLNFKRIEDFKAEGVYNLFREISLSSQTLDNPIGQDTSLSQLEKTNPELYNQLFGENGLFLNELELFTNNSNKSFRKKKGNVTLNDILDIIVFKDSTNAKTLLNVDNNGNLNLGSLAKKTKITRSELEENSDETKQIVLDFLKNKRYNVLVTKGSESINFNNRSYLNYLINNKILSTNAVVNEPTFQGYSNIYISNHPSDFEINKTRDLEKEKVQEIKDAFESIKDSIKGASTEMINNIVNNITSGKESYERATQGLPKSVMEAVNERLKDFKKEEIPLNSAVDFLDNDAIAILVQQEIDKLLEDKLGKNISTVQKMMALNQYKTEIDAITNKYNNMNSNTYTPTSNEVTQVIDMIDSNTPSDNVNISEETINELVERLGTLTPDIMEALNKSTNLDIYNELVKLANQKEINIEDIQKRCK